MRCWRFVPPCKPDVGNVSMKSLVLLGTALLLPALSVPAQTTTGILGDWRESSGSVIRIAPCGGSLCATLVQVSAAAPVSVDGNNPDSNLRTRPLCGLPIGQGFRSSDPNKAEDGKLYDPKSGKTYKGTMTSEGNTLLLRGYIGVSLFGRTAKWDRVTTPVEVCKVDAPSGVRKLATPAAAGAGTPTVSPEPKP